MPVFLEWLARKKRRLAPAAWPILEAPKNLGGLGFGNMKTKNLGLLAKWLWKYLTNPHSLWRILISEKYKYGPHLNIRDLQIPSSGGPWKGLCSAILSNPHSKALITSCVRKCYGNGLDSAFLHDTWIGSVPLKSMCPRLFLIASTKNARMADNCSWNGLGWNWALIWSRPLRPQDLVEHQALLKYSPKLISPLLIQVHISGLHTKKYGSQSNPSASN